MTRILLIPTRVTHVLFSLRPILFSQSTRRLGFLHRCPIISSGLLQTAGQRDADDALRSFVPLRCRLVDQSQGSCTRKKSKTALSFNPSRRIARRDRKRTVLARINVSERDSHGDGASRSLGAISRESKILGAHCPARTSRFLRRKQCRRRIALCRPTPGRQTTVFAPDRLKSPFRSQPTAAASRPVWPSSRRSLYL
jgi:hypothetical protein